MWLLLELTAWNLAKEITNKQDHYTSLVLSTSKVEFIFKSIQARECNSIAIQVVEYIHQP